MDPNDRQSQQPGAMPLKPPGIDVKPRLTKEQHDVLEQHFQQQHKPSTSVKKDFARSLGVPLDKINNWFQNRRAKVKQDRKKLFNQMNMQMGMYQPQPMPGQFPQHPHQDIPQPVMMQPHFYPGATAANPSSLSVQSAEGSPLELGAQMPLQQPFEAPYPLRSIPESNSSAAYGENPGIIMRSMSAAAHGAFGYNSGLPINTQDSGYPYDSTGLPGPLPEDASFTTPVQLSTDSTFQFAGLEDPLNIDFHIPNPGYTSAQAVPDVHSVGSQPSPYSNPQALSTPQTSSDATPPSVPSLNSVYSGWTDSGASGMQASKLDDSEPFANMYSLPQESSSNQALQFWDQFQSTHAFPQPSLYQQQNVSSQVLINSPDQQLQRTLSSAPSDLEPPPVFTEDAMLRRNSSTSNLATNIESIQIRNGTPENFKQPEQPDSGLGARRQKRPSNLPSSAMRSASYSAPMPSPGGSNDHTLRRIRSSGIGNVQGRVQKSQPGSAQRSPMVMNFADAASSPKFQRAFSSSNVATAAQAGSLAPPTPLTPQDIGHLWQSSAVIRPHSVMPEHNSPESLDTAWSVGPQQAGLLSTYTPPTSSWELQQVAQTTGGPDAVHRDSPPQSAPPTQENFQRPAPVHNPQMRAAFHSSTDLTISQPKPSHFRRPSLPETAQAQPDQFNMHYLAQHGHAKYADLNNVSLKGIKHNVPFAPSLDSMPAFLVHQYSPPQANGMHGGFVPQPPEPQPKSYIFANQGPSNFRT